jgi:hypothetical protein
MGPGMTLVLFQQCGTAIRCMVYVRSVEGWRRNGSIECRGRGTVNECPPRLDYTEVSFCVRLWSC